MAVRIFLLTGLLLALACVAGEEATPAKVLILGFPYHIAAVASWFEADPLVDPHQVPARTHLTSLQGSDIKRFIRLYYPRSYDRLLEYEYLMLLVVEIFSFTQKQQKQLHDAIYVDGKGAVQDRSVMSMAEWIAHPWAESIVSDAFPNDADDVVSQRFSYPTQSFRYYINTHPSIPPIFSPYREFEGVEATLVVGTTCIAIPKDGAVVTSYIAGGFPYSYPGRHADPRFRNPGWMPHTMYWEYGNGTTWTHNDMTGGDIYWSPARNIFSVDMLMAEFMFSTGRDLPKDVLLVHNLRGKFTSFASSRDFIYSILDFVDKFGASGTPVVKQMQAISGDAAEGKRSYITQEYARASSIMDVAIAEMDSLRSDAMALKDRALFWVYLTEWLAVSGTSLMAGFIIWSLMVRRRLYRTVTVTRLTSTDWLGLMIRQGIRSSLISQIALRPATGNSSVTPRSTISISPSLVSSGGIANS